MVQLHRWPVLSSRSLFNVTLPKPNTATLNSDSAAVLYSMPYDIFQSQDPVGLKCGKLKLVGDYGACVMWVKILLILFIMDRLCCGYHAPIVLLGSLSPDYSSPVGMSAHYCCQPTRAYSPYPC